MDQTSSDHLYVMQAADGFLKIGRSSHPSKRRDMLEHEICVGIEVVAIDRQRGGEERAILAALANHHAHGEWFHDTPEARSAIASLFNCKVKFRQKVRRQYDRSSNHPKWADIQLAWWIADEEWKMRRKTDPEFTDPRPVRPIRMPVQRPI